MYLWVVNENNDVYVSFLMFKVWVVFIKFMLIFCMELMVVVVLVNVIVMLECELDYISL